MQCFCTHEQTACNGPMLSQHSDCCLCDCPVHIICVCLATFVNHKQQQGRKFFRSLKMVEHVFSNQTRLWDLQHIWGGCILITNPPHNRRNRRKGRSCLGIKNGIQRVESYFTQEAKSFSNSVIRDLEP